MSKKFATSAVCALVLASFAAPLGAATMQQYPIVDRVLSMTAWTLTAPAGWRVDGAAMPPPSCSSGTTPVYKTTSPDGSSGAYFLPRADWTWGAGPSGGSDCLSFGKVVSAQDFTAYQLRTDRMGYVSTLAPPASSSMPPGFHVDTARVLARYVAAGRTYDAVVTTSVICHDEPLPAGASHHCTALVTRWFGPVGTVVPHIATFEAIQTSVNPQWMAAWIAAMKRKLDGIYGPETQKLLDQGNLAQAARTREHNRFMAAQQESADLRSMRFNEHLYTKQRNTDDFVDYVLDCTRFYNNEHTFRVSGTNCPKRQTM